MTKEWGKRRGHNEHQGHKGRCREGTRRPRLETSAVGVRLPEDVITAAAGKARELSRSEGRRVSRQEVYRRLITGTLPRLDVAGTGRLGSETLLLTEEQRKVLQATALQRESSLSQAADFLCRPETTPPPIQVKLKLDGTEEESKRAIATIAKILLGRERASGRPIGCASASPCRGTAFSQVPPAHGEVAPITSAEHLITAAQAHLSEARKADTFDAIDHAEAAVRSAMQALVFADTREARERHFTVAGEILADAFVLVQVVCTRTSGGR